MGSISKDKYQKMCRESEQFASEYTQSQEILADRYQQEMSLATHNIKEGVDKSISPYLGETLSEPLTTIDLAVEE